MTRGEIYTAALVAAHVPHAAGSGHHHARAGWVQTDCPFCGPGTGRFHLGFHAAFGHVNCWRCGRLPLRRVLVALLGGQRGAETLAAIFGARVAAQAIDRGGPPKWEQVAPPAGLGPLQRPHKQYLARRGVGPRTATLWGLQGCGPASGRHTWRVFIPWFYRNRLASWQTRAIGDNVDPRYLAAGQHQEAVPIKSLLYGEDFCRGTVVVVEGPTDAWAIGPGAVALGGLAWTPAQLRKLASWPRRFIVFDNEPPAQRTARRLAGELAVFGGHTSVVQIDAPDPGSASRSELQSLRRALLQ